MDKSKSATFPIFLISLSPSFFIKGFPGSLSESRKGQHDC